MREKRRDDVVFVGQAPADGQDPRHPLVGGSTGRRLAGLLEMTDLEFAVAFERVNVLDEFPGRSAGGDAFPPAKARRGARALMPRLKNKIAILLGRGVATAFGFGNFPFLSEIHAVHRLSEDRYCPVRYVIFPHPSGRSRWWNDSERAWAAGDFLRALISVGI